MELYNVVLFLHIMGAVVLVGVGFVAPLIMGGADRAGSIASWRDWIGVMQKVSKTAGMSAGLVFLSGLYMGLTGNHFSKAWLSVSLVLFFINGALAGGVLDKWLKRLMEQAEPVPDGPVPPALRAAQHEPKMQVVELLMLCNDFALVFLMTNKPGWTGAIATVVVSLAATAVLVARARSRRPAVAAA